MSSTSHSGTDPGADSVPDEHDDDQATDILSLDIGSDNAEAVVAAWANAYTDLKRAIDYHYGPSAVAHYARKLVYPDIPARSNSPTQ